MTAHSQIDGRKVHWDEKQQGWFYDDTQERANQKSEPSELREAARNVLARWTELDTGDEILDERMDALRQALWPGPDSLQDEEAELQEERA